MLMKATADQYPFQHKPCFFHPHAHEMVGSHILRVVGGYFQNSLFVKAAQSGFVLRWSYSTEFHEENNFIAVIRAS